MKDNFNIEDWYKNEVENYSVPPDANSWDKLSDQLNHEELLTDEKMDEWYKKELEKVESQPDNAVWEKLSTRLDTSSVWEKLAVTLTKYERFVWWRNTLLKTAALLLFFAGLTVTINNNSPESVKSNSQLISENPNALLNNKHLKNSIYSKLTSENSNQEELIEEQPIFIKKSTINVPSKINNQKSFNENLIVSKKSSFNANELYSNSAEINANYYENNLHKTISAKEFLIKKENNKIIFNNKRFTSNFAIGVYAQRFYLGLNGGVKKQGMFTKINELGTLQNYKQETLLDHGSSIGATLGIILTDKLNIETNINYASNGFRKKYISNEEVINERLSLSYTNISLLAKRTYNKSTFDSKTYSTNIIAGAYVGVLNSSKTKINSSTLNSSNYENIDLGLVLGIEQDRYISKTLVITPGIRYYQGVKNSATTQNPLSSAYSYSVEFNLGLKYIFLKRN
ncbi:MAG: hypothetical protein CVT95_06025 [Bacteroidetes bacterium HGW-Bacteroidetes-12]|nr:MAG: hypothetical protein CVT95_06025 [Bacteroidetes bacterium HGW-Bacteroidetes-12]